MALHFSFGQRPGGGSQRQIGMIAYQYVMIGGRMTTTTAVDGLRTPTTIVREIKEHLGLSTGMCKGQAAIDRDAAADIGMPGTVKPVRDE